MFIIKISPKSSLVADFEEENEFFFLLAFMIRI